MLASALQEDTPLLTLKNHWVMEARHCPSPNFNARPDACDISLIVIHNISLPPGQFGGLHIDELFCNCLDPHAHPYFAEIAAMEVSSHFLIRRDGELVQYVPCDKRAWHAGKSQWQGRENCNDFSIGIELEGSDHEPYTTMQYARLNELLDVLRQHYGIPPQALAGHDQIAPGRKTDPGPAFEWARVEGVQASGKLA
ncbi:MAG: 1,6-anhydro-N-acetylmuramyl-L-alanine amidase AmpD [Alcanivoracaceae bacterium]|nr:1,6-anhydro-N-acetylmuramyl-L-alanine amidase AmpD [Alcanivoracaceae bacterium]